jgi:hypothetical protein
MATYQYQVLEVRDSLFRGKQSSSALQDVINTEAAKGWKLVQIMSEDIKGRMGIGSTSGVLILFEYQTG